MKGVIPALLLYRYRSDSSGKTNQMLQKYSGLCGSARMFRVYLTTVNRVSCIWELGLGEYLDADPWTILDSAESGCILTMGSSLRRKRKREFETLNGVQHLLCQKIWIYKRTRNLRIHFTIQSASYRKLRLLSTSSDDSGIAIWVANSEERDTDHDCFDWKLELWQDSRMWQDHWSALYWRCSNEDCDGKRAEFLSSLKKRTSLWYKQTISSSRMPLWKWI